MHYKTCIFHSTQFGSLFHELTRFSPTSFEILLLSSWTWKSHAFIKGAIDLNSNRLTNTNSRQTSYQNVSSMLINYHLSIYRRPIAQNCSSLRYYTSCNIFLFFFRTEYPNAPFQNKHTHTAVNKTFFLRQKSLKSRQVDCFTLNQGFKEHKTMNRTQPKHKKK